MNKLCTIALFILFSSFLSLAQTAILERNISLEISQESISTALKKISQQGDFTFSYNPSIIEANKIISFSANNKTVREVLFMIFQSKVSFKEKGKYLILQKNEDDENSKYFFVSGYVLDYQTGKKLTQASVYEPLTFASAVSNKYGYYQIKLPIKTSTLTIKAIKQNYQRQDLVVEVNKNQNINIILTPEPSNTIEVADIRKQDSLEIKKENPMLADSIVIQMVEVRSKERQSLAEKLKASFSTFFTSANQKIHQINIKDILSKKWQVGLVPYLSTNQLMGNTEVNFSLNFISGYNSGIKKAELGGGVNIVRNSVNGVQVGGLLNLVGKQMKGVQLSGLGNIVGGDVDFLQVGGLFNLNKGAMNGVQLGGLFNLNAMAHIGFQAAGLFNFNNRPSEGVQIGGLFNYQSDDYKGVQIGGLFNYMPHELNGVQISGLFNFAKKVRSGVQIGLFNYADSAVSLVPIGLFSYIRRGGYHPVEISINEMEFVNIALKTGVKKIYTILTVGMQPHQLSKRLWHFGYGIGSYWSLSRRLAINLDLTVHQINQDSFSRFLNLLNRASLSMEIKGKYWGLALGPAWNLLLTDLQNGNYQPIFDDFPSLSIRSNEVVESGLRIRSWIGGQVAVRMGK
ncbi:MAG: carboxypeptidase-like regulatory domain-containing protein [Thermoflexibacter sp.]|nr:carboxypeptidase-like regulatory domain-containing protein [Thermoflexibacter sp.]